MPRPVAPETAFATSLKAARRTRSQGRATITKTEAEKALKELGEADDGAAIVQRFLDGKDATHLSEKARQVLVDFVKGAGRKSSAGTRALEARLAAREEAADAGDKLKRARARLQQLVRGGGSRAVRGGLAQVHAWLDAAAADVHHAKAQVIRLADHAAKSATRELRAAERELHDASAELERLIAHARTMPLKRVELEELRAWLAAPLPEIAGAAHALGMFPRLTIKYPSDEEDPGTSSSPPGHTMTSMKYPSDNEDGGGAVTGGRKEHHVSAAHAGAIRRTFGRANDGSLSWKKGSVIEAHRGERFARLSLGQDATSGWAYTGFIPLGPLTVNAPDVDPNRVREFYVERTGGPGAITESIGPLKLR